MGTDWPEVQLGDVTELLTGFPFKSQFYTDAPDSIRLIRGDNVVQGRLRWDGVKRWPKHDAENYKIFQLRAGDVVLAMDRPWIEAGLKCSVIRENDLPSLLVQRVARLRGTECLDSAYLRWIIGSSAFTQHVLAVQTGTAVPHISGSQIREFRFRLPPLDEQRAIAHILGTLDDKIELNRRMNETLEEIARTLFTSWFVTFDPVRAKAEGRQPEGMDASTAALFPDSFVGSELGEIPAGWEVRQLAEILDINPTRALRKGDEATYLDMANVPTSGPRAENWRLRPFNSGSRFRNGDVLLARITPCLENGKTCYVDFLPENETGWGSTEFIVLHSRPPLPEVWAYCLARDPSFREHAIRSMSGSSGRQRVPADAVSRYRVAIPSDAVSSAFAQIVNPLFESIRLRDEESRTLAEIRDVPLPKLLSGEIYVRDLDRAVEYAASFNN